MPENQLHQPTRSRYQLPRLLMMGTLMLVSLGIGIYLRVISMSDPMWLDELHTAWCVAGGLGDVFERAAIGNQSPFFFWIEYIVFNWLGQDKQALRILPLLASFGLLVSIPWIVFRLSGSLVGAWLALSLAAFDDWFLYFSVEARPYGLIQLVVVWQVFYFLKFLHSDNTPRVQASWSTTFIRICVLSVVLFYLHFTTVLLLATELFVVLAWHLITRQKCKREFGHCLAAGLIVFAVCIPGLWMLYQIGAHRTDWQAMASPGRYGLMMMAAFAIYVLVTLVCVFCFRRDLLRKHRNAIGSLPVLASLVVLPMFICVAGTMTRTIPLAHVRFSIGSYTVMIVLSGVLFMLVNSRSLKLAISLSVLTLAVVTNPLTELWMSSGDWPAQRHEDWEKAMKLIRQDPLPVVLCPNLVEDQRFAASRNDEWMQQYYRFPVHGVLSVLEDSWEIDPVFGCSMAKPKLLLPNEIATLQRSRGCWLIVRSRTDDAARVLDDLQRQIQRPGWHLEVSRLAGPPVNLHRIVWSRSDP